MIYSTGGAVPQESERTLTFIPCVRLGTAGGALKILTPTYRAIVTSGEVRWLRWIFILVSLVRYLRRGALASRDFYPSLFGTLPQERCIVFGAYS